MSIASLVSRLGGLLRGNCASGSDVGVDCVAGLSLGGSRSLIGSARRKPMLRRRESGLLAALEVAGGLVFEVRVEGAAADAHNRFRNVQCRVGQRPPAALTSIPKRCRSVGECRPRWCRPEIHRPAPARCDPNHTNAPGERRTIRPTDNVAARCGPAPIRRATRPAFVHSASVGSCLPTQRHRPTLRTN